MIKYLIGLMVVLAIALMISVRSCTENKKEALRHETNMANVTNDNKQLTLKVGEYKHLQGEWKNKLDSVIQVNKIKLKQVTQATIVKTVYKDTTITKIVYANAMPQPNGSFIVPVSYDSQCWGMKGNILTRDALSKLNITEKTANNNLQLIVTRNKYFLGFLWRTKKAAYNVYSDCGPAQFTDIKFIK